MYKDAFLSQQDLRSVVAYLCPGDRAGDEGHSVPWPCVWRVHS